MRSEREQREGKHEVGQVRRGVKVFERTSRAEDGLATYTELNWSVATTGETDVVEKRYLHRLFYVQLVYLWPQVTAETYKNVE